MTEPQLAPDSLVARIIAELQDNPDAQRLLLRALLTNEFLGMPARLDAIEKDVAEIKADVVEIKADVAELKTNVARLNTGMEYLVGRDLENQLHRGIKSIICNRLELRRPRMMQSPLQETLNEFANRIDDGLDDGRINYDQYRRLVNTDFIIRAQRRDGRAIVWVAVEASNTVGETDISRARATADILKLFLTEEIIPVAAGRGIDPRDLARAEAAGVSYVKVE